MFLFSLIQSLKLLITYEVLQRGDRKRELKNELIRMQRYLKIHAYIFTVYLYTVYLIYCIYQTFLMPRDVLCIC